MSTILDRIQKIAHNERITIGALERQIEASKGVLSRAINQGTDIQSKWIQRIVENYPLYSSEWLLTGKGDMLKSNGTACDFSSDSITDFNNKDTKILAHKQVNKIHFPKSSEKIYEYETVALYDIEAAANLHTIHINREENIIGQIIIPNIPKCDGAIYVHGDSMAPLLKSGDIIAFKFVPNELSSIYYGEMYLVSMDLNGDDYLTVKYINRSERGDNWVKLVSHNSNYEPKDVPVSAIRSIALVKFSISMHTMS